MLKRLRAPPRKQKTGLRVENVCLYKGIGKKSRTTMRHYYERHTQNGRKGRAASQDITMPGRSGDTCDKKVQACYHLFT